MSPRMVFVDKCHEVRHTGKVSASRGLGLLQQNTICHLQTLCRSALCHSLISYSNFYFCRPSRRRRSVGVANATQPPLFLNTIPNLQFDSGTISPDGEDQEESKVSSDLCLPNLFPSLYFELQSKFNLFSFLPRWNKRCSQRSRRSSPTCNTLPVIR